MSNLDEGVELEVALICSELSDEESSEGESRLLKDSLARYYSEISHGILSKEEEVQLSKRILEHRDQEAIDILVTHNLRLVPWFINQYFAWSTIPLLDLIQEGNIGLITAAERFDHRKGRFSTYAIQWVRNFVQRAIMNQSGTIRTPVQIHLLRNKIVRAQRDSLRKEGTTPSIDNLVISVGVSAKEIREALISMEFIPLGSDDPGRSAIESVIPDPYTCTPEDEVQMQEQLALCCASINLVYETVSTLPGIQERDATIFKCRYGLNKSESGMTLDEVGKMFDVTRERVRQIVNDVWHKLRKVGIVMNEKDLRRQMRSIEELERFTGIQVRFNE